MPYDKQLEQAIFSWDVATWSRALSLWDKSLDWTRVETALEVGGNEGGLSIYTALKGIPTVCSDLESPEPKAKANHKAYGLSQLVSYAAINALEIPYESHFDCILFKSIAGGIARNGDLEKSQRLFDQIYKALKPGGTLLFAENLVGSSLHQYARKRFISWAKGWHYFSKGELHEQLSKYSKVTISTTGMAAAFGRSSGQKQFLAKADSLVFNSLCPSAWHYVSFGVAVK